MADRNPKREDDDDHDQNDGRHDVGFKVRKKDSTASDWSCR